ncbi:aminopeptidase [Bacteroidales bacterium]|nr:aminopeptidase [Bacteroidales bacterium]
MKHFFLFFISSFFALNIHAQDEAKEAKSFVFTTIKENPITVIKNQASSGTCWSYSGLALVESELLRLGEGDFNLSAMYIVHKNYLDKARKFIRLNGSSHFSPGGSFADVFDAIRDYGIVPDSLMRGLQYGEENHIHGELDALTSAYVSVITKNPNKKLSTAWFAGYNGIVDAYLGQCPTSITYKGKTHSPQSYAAAIGIVPENYISITSFTHHPFYEAFPIEVPDNWRWALSYNLPMDEMLELMNQAVEKGYTIAWASDVSEKGFTRKGIAIVPDIEAQETPGSDQAHWLGLNKKERENMLSDLNQPMPELKISQQMRQDGFDNYQTTDDHGMLIYGKAKDQNGSPYFMVKNSWGIENTYRGTWYASDTFVKYKTISIMLHKDALSKELRKKLKLNN